MREPTRGMYVLVAFELGDEGRPIDTVEKLRLREAC